jgi:hypothetical protein
LVILCGFQYVRDACHKTLVLPSPEASCIPAPRQPIPSITQGICLLGHPTPVQHIAWSPTLIIHRELYRVSPFRVSIGCGLRMMLYAGSRFEWLLHTYVLCSLRPFPFGSCLSTKFGKFCMTTLQPHLHSSLSIAICSTGSPRWLAVYRLSFPLLTRVYQTHARGRCFHSTTWRVGLSLT